MLVESYPRDGSGFALWLADTKADGAWQCRDMGTVLVPEEGFFAYSGSAIDLDSDGVAEVAVLSSFEMLPHHSGIVILPLDRFVEGT